jgi:hypothetical protein
VDRAAFEPDDLVAQVERAVFRHGAMVAVGAGKSNLKKAIV